MNGHIERFFVLTAGRLECDEFEDVIREVRLAAITMAQHAGPPASRRAARPAARLQSKTLALAPAFNWSPASCGLGHAGAAP